MSEHFQNLSKTPTTENQYEEMPGIVEKIKQYALESTDLLPPPGTLPKDILLYDIAKCKGVAVLNLVECLEPFDTTR